MRVEIVEHGEDQNPAIPFPPEENYLDLRANPRAVDQIATVRRHIPLRNFLVAVNGSESMFLTFGASVKSESQGGAFAGGNDEFASQITMIFTESSANFQRERFSELVSGLKDLLEREKGDAVRATLGISPCDFAEQKRRGFCLLIRLLAQGDSAQQAELRWGLALARVQQALLFRARTLRQKMGN